MDDARGNSLCRNGGDLSETANPARSSALSEVPAGNLSLSFQRRNCVGLKFCRRRGQCCADLLFIRLSVTRARIEAARHVNHAPCIEVLAAGLQRRNPKPEGPRCSEIPAIDTSKGLAAPIAAIRSFSSMSVGPIAPLNSSKPALQVQESESERSASMSR